VVQELPRRRTCFL